MTITALGRDDHRDDVLHTCGVARTLVDVRIVDGADRGLPPGELGEIVTRSDCVMRGYWNNPEASAETLRGGWLHTGDLGSMDERGYLTLKDRAKDLLISGGSNIYPREIEEVILRHARVLEVSVIGRPHPDWAKSRSRSSCRGRGAPWRRPSSTGSASTRSRATSGRAPTISSTAFPRTTTARC